MEIKDSFLLRPREIISLRADPRWVGSYVHCCAFCTAETFGYGSLPIPPPSQLRYKFGARAFHHNTRLSLSTPANTGCTWPWTGERNGMRWNHSRGMYVKYIAWEGWLKLDSHIEEASGKSILRWQKFSSRNQTSHTIQAYQQARTWWSRMSSWASQCSWHSPARPSARNRTQSPRLVLELRYKRSAWEGSNQEGRRRLFVSSWSRRWMEFFSITSTYEALT